MADIETLDISVRLCEILKENDMFTVEDLTRLCGREVLCFHRIGQKSLDLIEKALGKRGLAFAHDPYAPYTCARHGLPRGDTGLASLFLCDRCASDFQNHAFRGRASEYASPAVPGYCLHCNKQFNSVRMYQWYLCGICERVVKSIGRSVAADDYLMNWWHNEIQPQFPHLHPALLR